MAIANVLLGYGAGLKETVLTASDGSSNSRFGYAISMSKDGNYLAVGAAIATPDATYVFSRSGSTWSQMQKINTKGGYVAMNADGTRMVVSSYSSFDNEARLYTRSGSTWSLTGTVPYSGPVAISGDGQHFGVAHGIYVDFYSVSGSTITARGQVNSYPYVGATGIMSMDMDYTGSVCVVGTPEADVSGIDSGRLITLNRSGSTWTAAQVLWYNPPTGSAAGLLLGTSVAINSAGTTIEGGAPGYMEGRGASFTFTLSGGSWSNGSAWWDYGEPSARGKSVALDSTGARTAASGNDAVVVAGGGLSKILVGKPAGEGFGRQVSMSGDGKILAVGADNWNSNQGRVYVYG